MNDTASAGDVPDPASLRDEAAVWFARMRGEHAGEWKSEFEAWLARGALHRAAYNRVGDVFAVGKALKDAERFPGAESEAARASPHRFLIAGALGVAILIAVVTATFKYAPSSPGFIQRAEARTTTDVGQIKRLRLDDGTEVVLDTDSILVSGFGTNGAIARLERGRARFDVASRKAGDTILARSVKISAADGTFDVRLGLDGAVETAVLRGNVWVRAAGPSGANLPARAAIRIEHGNSVAFDGTGQVAVARSRGGTRWTAGILEFSDTPLAGVLAEANRYSIIKVVAADHAIERLKVSGRFRIDNAVSLARRLALALDLTVDAASPLQLTLRKRR